MTLREWLSARLADGKRTVSVKQVIEKLDEQMATRRGKNGKVAVTPDDLLGVFEVAELLNVDRTRPSKWRLKGTTFGPDRVPFPEPFAVLRGATSKGDTPVYLRSEIEALRPFVEQRRRNRT